MPPSEREAMATQSGSGDGETPRPDKRRRGLVVVSSAGARQRFLRGAITHDLVQRGLDFDLAYAAANAVRERLSDRDEVTTDEIRELIRKFLAEELGEEPPASLLAPLRPVTERFVVYGGTRQPFSRGLLARSIYATGVDVDRAYRLIMELENGLQEEGILELASEDLARRVGELLEHLEGAEAARRYRMVRGLNRLPRPLVIYLGGASGTGKSTLSLELAPLLRIYRINATDTIRQVMRMVFSQEVLPAIHTSSFELLPPPGGWSAEEVPSSADPEFAERLLANFEEQARRVNVGIRALVERAVAENMSIVVEGVHLYPPLVPFPDLEGAAYQVPIILTTPDAETHRARFLTRGRLGRRRTERYLENFASIRMIHDFLLQQAEAHEVPLLDTTYESPPAVAAVRLITSLLEKRVPGILASVRFAKELAPSLLLVIDGLPDRPVRALGGRTPLEAARTPTLDRLAREGRCGLADPVAPGVVPDTAAGSLALFGQSPLAMKRGPVEALGATLEPRHGDVALRANLCTLDAGGQVIDRRAGRIRAQAAALAAALDRLPLPGHLADEVEVRVKPATEHRLAIVLRGEGLSSAIQGSDPGETARPGPPLTPRPVDPHDEKAVHTARVLALFELEAREVLRQHPINAEREAAGKPPANAVLTRGAGTVHRLVPLEENGLPLSVACVAGDRTILGLAKWLGFDAISRKGMTANLDTDLEAKLRAATRALKTHDLVIVHVKGADIAAHDQRPDLKVAFLERLDRHLGEMLERHPGPLRIAVASDHATLSESGQHAADPLPVLIWGTGVEADGVTHFAESAVASGALQRFPLQLLLGKLFDLG
jgi:2,3-bisphosphoglycerate-independent phosphoglycerate mutase